MDDMTTAPYARLRQPVRPEALASLDPQVLRQVHSAWQSQVLAMLRSRQDSRALQALHHLTGQLEEAFRGTGVGLFWHLSHLAFLALESGDLRLHRGHRLGYAIQLEKTLHSLRQAHARHEPVQVDAAAAGALMRLVASAHPRHQAILLEQDRINLERWLFGDPDPDCCAPPPHQALAILVKHCLGAAEATNSGLEITP